VSSPPIRYMGTKRHVVPLVKDGIEQLRVEPKRFVDLFAGTCSVATEMAGRMPVTCCDALSFPVALARPRLLARHGPTADVKAVVQLAHQRATPRLAAHAVAVNAERDALARGFASTKELLSKALHVGNDPAKMTKARQAKAEGAHCLATLYFARGYFSTEQAVWLDALRQSIDELHPPNDIVDSQVCTARDLLIAAWLAAASRVANSPGHTAQYLAAANPASKIRVQRAWSRSVLREFELSLGILQPIGTSAWRRTNRLVRADATVGTPTDRRRYSNAVLYADPPYTKDHYSRYYHVLETLFRYDYPDAHGRGRVRSDRHLSDFCYRSKAAGGFAALGARAAVSGSPLLVSYPSHGLLERDELVAALEPFGRVRRTGTLEHVHSTMGASKGTASLDVTECLYLLEPT
jgi:adenine-specific DNA-methyltransferase